MFERGLLVLLATLAVAFSKVAFSSEDPCEGLTDCRACFKKSKNGPKCKWFVPNPNSDGIEQCISKSRCKGMEDGKCLKRKKGCSSLGLSCSDYSGKGKCGGCLKNGCFWIKELKSCVDDCKLAPPDTTCASTTPTKNPEPESVDPGVRRSLLRFASEADMMCYYFKLEDKNRLKCKKAGKTKGAGREKGKERRSCLSCVTEELDIAPTTKPVAEFCKWFPETGSCSLKSGMGFAFLGTPQDYCDCKKKKREWPELVSGSTDDAREAIEGDCPTHEVITVLEGTPVTKDAREDRVRIFHWKNFTVSQTPRIG